MIEFIPSIIFFLIQLYLLFRWIQSRRSADGKDGWVCLWGFLVGQVFYFYFVYIVSPEPPAPDSPEQYRQMGQFMLGGFLGGLFTIMGLLYLFGILAPKK
ncbi:MAG: hypothetical protein AAGD96_04635 [Chloroflexota bacterium]